MPSNFPMIPERLGSIWGEELCRLFALNSQKNSASFFSFLQGKVNTKHEITKKQTSDKVEKKYSVKIRVCKSNMIIASNTVSKSR